MRLQHGRSGVTLIELLVVIAIFHDGKLFIDTEIVDFQGAKGLPDSTFTPYKR